MAMKDLDQEYELAEVVNGSATGKTFVVSREVRFASTDREFKIGGHVFRRKAAVAPESILPWNQLITGELDPFPKEVEVLGIFDATVLAFLEPGQDEDWARVRAQDAEQPLTDDDIKGLIRWLIAADAGRPTGPSSDSPEPSERTSSATPSREPASSPEVVGSPA